MRDESRKSRSLKTLWRDSLAGDTQGVNALVCEIDPHVRRAVWGLLRAYGSRADREQHQDLVQEVYCRLLDKERRVLRRCRGESEEEVRAYLKRVTRSVVVDSLRRQSAAKRGADRQVDLLAAGLEMESRPDERARADQQLVLEELRCQFREECRQASRTRSTVERDSWIAERVFVDGWTSREVADRVCLSASSVDTLISRLRSRLRGQGLRLPHRGAFRGSRRR